MAVAFYIPDQQMLLRKAKEQEQQILRMREKQWRLVASMVLGVFRQYTNSQPTVLRCCDAFRSNIEKHKK